MIYWIIAIILLLASGISAGTIGWSKLMKEHRDMLALPLEEIDFERLSDGTFDGHFDGGVYHWRENTIRVTVEAGKVTAIVVVQSKEERSKTFVDELFKRIIDKSSLHVDAISGATLTSKAFLKGVEDALKKAQKR